MNIKKLLYWTLFWAFIIFSPMVKSQGVFSWLSHYGGGGDDVGYAVVEADSSIYIGGWFEGSVTLGNYVLNSQGSSDIYLARMTYSGDIIWARRFGGVGMDNIVGITADNNGNIYFSGFCSEYSDFGSYFFPGYGGWDAFVCKIALDGTVKWALTGGGIYDDQAYRVSLNDYGDRIAFTGLYRDFATFWPYLLPPWGGRDAYVAIVDSSGNYLWLDFFGNFSDDVGYALDFDSLNNLYLSGYFFSTYLNFGPFGLINYGEFDTYLTKFNSQGTVLWAKSIGGPSSELPRHLEVIGMDLYLGGYQYASGNFLGIQLTSNTGSQDAFLLKADSSGNGLWGFNGLSGSPDEMIGMSVIPGDAVYFCGGYTGTLEVAGVEYPSQGGYDAFIVKVNESDGTPIGCVTGGGLDNDMFFGVSANSNSIYATGCFIGEATFGEYIIESSGWKDILICKLEDILLEIANSEEHSIQVFPNPFSVSTTCRIIGVDETNLTMELFNGMGQRVMSREVEGINTFTILRNDLPSGVYYLAVTNSARLVTGIKLIIY